MIHDNILHYRIIKKLGAGGQGAVYEARDTKLGRTVVIKVLPAEMTANKVNLGRFEREARLASSLDHPNICTIFDLNVAADVHFIAMQYVSGRNVRELVDGHPLSLRSALSICIQVCDALAVAHSRGIIHRDIKAHNVMVTDEGQVKILDFGLAKLLDEQITRAEDTHLTELTEVGVPYGTATYAAPEQAQGLKVDARADIFSTGVLLYEMLTGKWPFHGKTTIDVRYAVLHETPRPLEHARPEPTPPRLQEILDRAMAKAPEDRYQSMAEFRDDLRRVLQDLSVAGDAPVPGEFSTSAPLHLKAGGSLSSFKRKPQLIGVLAIIGLIGILAIGLWVLFGTKSSGAIAADAVIVRLHGSNTIGAKLAPALAEEFFRHLGAKEVRTVPGKSAEESIVLGVLPGEATPKAIQIESHGSATAFTDLLARSCDIGLSSRKIKPEELQTLSTLGDMTSAESEHIVALDGIAVIVNSKNPIDSLTKDQIAKIFSGEITNWTQVLSPQGKIKIYARDDKSGTYDSFKSLVLGAKSLASGATRLEDSVALSDAVAGDPDGIGFIGLPYIRNAKAVAVSEGEATALLPNRLTVATEDYPLSRRLYFYAPGKKQTRWVNQFIEFALSSVGQDVVAAHGLVALHVNAESPSVVQNAPGKYKLLTSGAERLSLNFRFQKGGKELDNKARLDLDRVVDFVSDLKLSGQNLLLFGFADDSVAGEQNLALSIERAGVVAEQFKRRGIAPAVIDGFGSWMPVASNSTEDGKERNRRVEVWLRR